MSSNLIENFLNFRFPRSFCRTQLTTETRPVGTFHLSGENPKMEKKVKILKRLLGIPNPQSQLSVQYFSCAEKHDQLLTWLFGLKRSVVVVRQLFQCMLCSCRVDTFIFSSCYFLSQHPAEPLFPSSFSLVKIISGFFPSTHGYTCLLQPTKCYGIGFYWQLFATKLCGNCKSTNLPAKFGLRN